MNNVPEVSHITQEEFYRKYGDVDVWFESYYKYTFAYRAELSESEILFVWVGGACQDIYDHEVVTGTTQKVKNLDAYTGSVYHNGVLVESFYVY